MATLVYERVLAHMCDTIERLKNELKQSEFACVKERERSQVIEGALSLANQQKHELEERCAELAKQVQYATDEANRFRALRDSAEKAWGASEGEKAFFIAEKNRLDLELLTLVNDPVVAEAIAARINASKASAEKAKP